MSSPATGFDWAGVRRRLAELAAALAEGGASSAERTHALLERRAAKLAQPEAAQAAETIEVLRFEHAGETWAVETRCVLAVAPLRSLTPLPGAGDGVVGVAAWRGEPLVVRELGTANARRKPAAFALVLGARGADFAIAADAIPEVAAIERDRIRPAPADMMQKRPWLVGVTEHAELVIHGDELIAHIQRGNDA